MNIKTLEKMARILDELLQQDCDCLKSRKKDIEYMLQAIQKEIGKKEEKKNNKEEEVGDIMALLLARDWINPVNRNILAKRIKEEFLPFVLSNGITKEEIKETLDYFFETNEKSFIFKKDVFIFLRYFGEINQRRRKSGTGKPDLSSKYQIFEI